jgi:hypothetical protein
MVPIIENPSDSAISARETLALPSLCGDERQFSVQHYQDDFIDVGTRKWDNGIEVLRNLAEVQ